MGKLGIPTWCYEWMTDFNWLRTKTDIVGRGGSLVSGFDASVMAQEPDTELGPISEEKLWETLEHFLTIVVPVAERAGSEILSLPLSPAHSDADTQNCAIAAHLSSPPRIRASIS